MIFITGYVIEYVYYFVECYGKDPMGIAATALYIACLNTGEKRTQTDIARAVGITEVTLRN